MDLVKKIGIRAVLVCVIIMISNLIYKRTSYQADLKSEGNVLLKFEEAVEKADVLYFSASPNAATHREDKDQRFISQMVDDGLQELKVMAVDTGAIHAGVFRNLVEMIPDKSPVQTVIVHLNYRSFGMGWIESKLENAIQKEMVFYNNRPAILNRFLQGLNYYDAVSGEEREQRMLSAWATQPLPFDAPKNTVENWCAEEKWGDWTHPQRQLADHYIKNFAFTLEETNPRLKDFDAIAEICRQKGLRLIYVLLPENLEEAGKLVDKDLTDLMKRNRDQLVKRYSDKGVTVIDLFEEVPDSVFIERHFPSEHYRESGRRIIADAIIAALQP